MTGAEDGNPSNLVLDDDDRWWSEVTANPAAKTLVFYAHTDDYQSIFHSTEEYRFDGTQVLMRLLEDYVEHPGERVWHVKDGVVLESAIKKRAEESKFTLTPVEEELTKYRAQVEWRPVQNLKLRFFVMAQHPAEFPVRERRRLIRTELERLDAGARKIIGDVKAHGLEVIESENGPQVRYPASFTEADRTRASGLFTDDYFAAAGISESEFQGVKTIRSELLALLGEVPTV